MGKGEIARNELFLLFPQCFVELEEPKIGLSGKGLTYTKVNLEKLSFDTAKGFNPLPHNSTF